MLKEVLLDIADSPDTSLDLTRIASLRLGCRHKVHVSLDLALDTDEDASSWTSNFTAVQYWRRIHLDTRQQPDAQQIMPVYDLYDKKRVTRGPTKCHAPVLHSITRSTR